MKQSLAVVMLTFNHSRFILKALESVRLQELAPAVDKTLIVVDDCSRDDTVQIIRSYEPKLVQAGWSVVLRAHETNLGVQRTAREAFSLVQSDFCAFLEGDDFWISPNKLALQMEVLNNTPGASICFSRAQYVDADGNIIGASRNFAKRQFMIEDAAKKNHMHTPTLLFRYSKTTPGLDWIFSAPVVDWPLILHHLQFGFALFVPQETAAYRIHSTSYWSGMSAQLRLERWLQTIDLVEANLPRALGSSFAINRSRTLLQLLWTITRSGQVASTLPIVGKLWKSGLAPIRAALGGFIGERLRSS